MKRLVRYPVESGSTIDLVKLAKNFIDKLFKSLDDSLETVSKWIEDDSNTKNGSNNEASVPDHVVMEVLPASEDDEWNESNTYRMLIKLLGEDKDYISLRFDMKSPDNSVTASDTATLEQRLEDESDKELKQRVIEMFQTMATKLLRKCTKDNDMEVLEMRDVTGNTY